MNNDETNTISRQEAYGRLHIYKHAIEKLEQAKREFDKAEADLQEALHRAYPLK